MGSENHRSQKVKRKPKGDENVNMFSFTNSCTSSVKCLFTNADSLLNKFAELQALIHDESPHIIAICEVKPKNSRYAITDPEVQIAGYDMLKNDLGHGKHRGCIMYIDNRFKATEITTDKSKDAIWCEVKMKNEDKLLIGLTYRSPSNNKQEDHEMYENIRKMMQLHHTHKLIVGDFNLPEIQWEHWTTQIEDMNHPSNRVVDLIRDCYLYQHINQPTRQSGDNQPTVLDLVLTNEEKMVKDIHFFSPLGKSDHYVLKFNLTCYAFDKGDYPAMVKGQGAKVILHMGW